MAGNLQYRDACFPADLSRIVVPDGGLDFADVRFAQQQHAETALADAAADGVGQFARQQRLVEGQFSAVVAARDGELSVQTFGDTRMPMLEISMVWCRISFQNRMSQLSSQSS